MIADPSRREPKPKLRQKHVDGCEWQKEPSCSSASEPAAPWTLGPSMAMVISKCPCACVEVAASPGLPPVSGQTQPRFAGRWPPSSQSPHDRKASDSHLTWSIVPRCQVRGVSSSRRPGRSVPWFASRQTQPCFAGPLQANRQSPHDCKASDSSIVPRCQVVSSSHPARPAG